MIERDRLGPFYTRGEGAAFLPSGVIALLTSVVIIVGSVLYGTFGPGLQCASEQGTAYWFASMLGASGGCLAVAASWSVTSRIIAVPIGSLLGIAAGFALAHVIFAPFC